MEQRPWDASKPGAPPFYLVLTNTARDTNVGKLIRTAVAFGAQAVVVVGRRAVKLTCSMGTHAYVPIVRLASLEAAATHLRALGARMVGVEGANASGRGASVNASSSDGSALPELPVTSPQAFCGATALLLPNEGGGLTDEERAVCDALVFLEGAGRGVWGSGLRAINVSCAAAVVMYTFSAWAAAWAVERDGAAPVEAIRGAARVGPCQKFNDDAPAAAAVSAAAATPADGGNPEIEGVAKFASVVVAAAAATTRTAAAAAATATAAASAAAGGSAEGWSTDGGLAVGAGRLGSAASRLSDATAVTAADAAFGLLAVEAEERERVRTERAAMPLRQGGHWSEAASSEMMSSMFTVEEADY